MNNQKFATVTKFISGSYCAFYEGKSIGGICKTKKECIEDLRDLGYIFLSGNNKVKLSKSLTTDRTLVTVSRVSYGYVDNATFVQTTKATESVQECINNFITLNNLQNA
jgi:UDP-N-acetylmuramyl pentapeptide synthase